jgi:diaminopimelate epimerase
MKISFTKMEGSGNDFILIDNRDGKIPYLKKETKQKLCSRKKGIGADGILLLEKDKELPFMMRYFNADGGEAEMCGNGARCAAVYAFKKRLVPRKFSFKSKSGTHNAEILKNNLVKVELPAVEFKKNIRISVEGKPYNCSFLIVGVPHIIVFVKNIESIDVLSIGKRRRNLKQFKQRGTNVNFVKKLRNNKLTIRTYERGVEDETLSCGTGTAAAAYIAYRKKMVSFPVYVKTASGETLTVLLSKTKGKFVPSLQGTAHIVFSGTLGD